MHAAIEVASGVQAQRAGNLPADHASLFPGLSWKQAGYVDVCQGYLTGTLEAEDAQNVNFQDFPGYFEAGSALFLSSCWSVCQYQELVVGLGRCCPNAEETSKWCLKRGGGGELLGGEGVWGAWKEGRGGGGAHWMCIR